MNNNELVVGIDEAGRGPIIGPMVLTGVLVDSEGAKQLQDLGVKDSKKLTPLQRESMYDQVIKISKNHKTIIISPKEIDEALASDTLNLNWLEAIKTAMIINALKPDKAIVDCPSTNEKAYKDYLKTYLKDKNIKLVVENKADENYLESAAASIIAKVTRDREIEKIKKEIGIDFNSGYPSDPKTKEFLQNYWNKYPEIFRKSWSSYQKFAGKPNQKNLGDF